MAFVGGVTEVPKGGFSFENCRRNDVLASKGFPAPKAVKTGTTIAGFVFKDGVILGSDTRATEGNLIAIKNCTKLHYMAPNMYCAGAGTAADLEMTTMQMSSQLELHRLNTGRQVKVATAVRMLRQHLFRYQGHIGAALIMGGVDSSGGHVVCIYPHGSSDNLPYVTMGSGSLAAMSVLEAGWKPDMELAEAKELMKKSICAGIFNDLMSGSHADIVVITREKVDFIRPFEVASKKGERQGSYRYQRGASAVLSTRVIPFEIESTQVRPIESMEVA